MMVRTILVAALVTVCACTLLHAETYTENLERITDYFMTDLQYSSVKIPGLDEQINSAWNMPLQFNCWKNVSPGYTNVPMHVIMDGNNIIMQIDIGGLAKSTDGGYTWKHIQHHQENGIDGITFNDFDISPLDSNIIVQGGDRIYRSLDGGANWETPYITHTPLLYYSTRGCSFGQVKYNSNGSVLFTAIGTRRLEPYSIETFFADNYAEKFILYSTDNAATFNKIEIPESDFSVIKRIYAHPSDQDIVYFSFGDGDFYVTFNATSSSPTLQQIAIPSGYFVRDMCVKPNDSLGTEMLLTLRLEKLANAIIFSIKKTKNGLIMESCIYCKSSGIVKNGKTVSGDQEFYCKKCKSYFTSSSNPDYHRSCFDTETMLLATLWYFRFNLSLRNLAEIMLSRGIDVSHQTILVG